MDMTAAWPGWTTVRLLGRGSFGAVYEIEREVLGHKEKAALKVITIPQSGDEIDELYSSGYDEESITAHFRDFLSDIVREYTLMTEMKGHTNVVCCDDIRYVQHDDGFGWDIFIKMELLTPLIKTAGAVSPEEQAVRLGCDLCRALALCRSRNILHRDIKPQNIFVSKDGDYKLGDFGIAKTVEKTSGGTKIGTYSYMAPEVYNNRPYGHTADIYSLGLVLYWLLNERRLPFNPLPPAVPRNADMENARARRFSGEPIPAPKHGSRELKRIVLKACAFDPKDRYQSAEEMLLDLERLGEPAAAAVADADATVGVFGAARAADEEETATVGVRRPRPEKQSPGRAEASRQPRSPQTARKTPPKRRGAKWPLAVFLPLAAMAVIVGAVFAVVKTRAAFSDEGDLPASAQLLKGTAEGRSGPIEVEIAADEERIYRIKVVSHSETEGIGSLAIEKIPDLICESQSLKVDAVSGATISSNGVKAAVLNALLSGGIDPSVFGGSVVKVGQVAAKAETNSGITVIHAADWAEKYPDEYRSWLMNVENGETTDYLKQYPPLRSLYEGFGFSIDYDSARGHNYAVEDIEQTNRPHPMANCWTCKTPDFTAMVLRDGEQAYKYAWAEVQGKIVESISCFDCHANEPGKISVTHSYLIDAVGEDFDRIDAADLACGQCHSEYYFEPATKAVAIAHDSIASMHPTAMLEYYNDPTNFSGGEAFADWTNPRTGVRQIKVQHPEFETYLGEGSQHRATYTCADCHMPVTTGDSGTTYRSHKLISPLDNPELIENECSKCHVDLVAEVRDTQAKVEARTAAVGDKLENLTELLAAAAEKGDMSEAKLNEVRALARDAQFYWDFVFTENSGGAHNSKLADFCLDKAEELAEQAIGLMKGTEADAADQSPAPTPEPPLSASVSTSASGGRTLLTTASAEASSFINASQIGNSRVTIRYPGCAIDGDTASSWQEAAEGYGIDEWLTVSLEGTANVQYISLWLGNWESGQMYQMNGRPSELRLEFSDGSSVVCQFPDEMAEFEVKLSRPVQTTWVKLTVLGAYAGTRWEDTCISEIKIYA